ncbi:MAG: hypothetical protein LBW85_02600 [Deltaproteobacteria bacterium]|jgi:hypothetical protein|nr:hypothetical protein [Deltaproteobacteria bacterium]
MQSSACFLERELKLKASREKSRVGSPLKLKFPGFSLCKIGDRSGIRPHEKLLRLFRYKVIRNTKRNRGACDVHAD